MLCIDNTTTDVHFNLAAEEYLLRNSGEDFFMLWQSEPSVIVGRHQDIFAEADLDFAGQQDITLARRYSGGGAVYHDQGNLNLTFIETNPQIDFEKYNQAIIRFLKGCGLNAEADSRRGLYIDGLKISGSAQAIQKSRVLYHATLLYESNLDDLARVLDAKPGQSARDADAPARKYVPSDKKPVTNIIDHLQQGLGISAFRKSILDYVLSLSPGNKTVALSPGENAEITLLKENKYADPEWIFNGSIRKRL